MADYSVAFPQNEEVDSTNIPNINLLIGSILASMSGMVKEDLLDQHESEGKYVSFLAFNLLRVQTPPYSHL